MSDCCLHYHSIQYTKACLQVDMETTGGGHARHMGHSAGTKHQPLLLRSHLGASKGLGEAEGPAAPKTHQRRAVLNVQIGGEAKSIQ